MLLKKFNNSELAKKETKNLYFDVKQMSEQGVIEGYGSVSGNVDSYDDVVMPGAFKKTLQDNRQAKRKLPMLWQHKMDEPIGYWFDTFEDQNGLYLKGQLDLNVERAREAYSLIKNQVINGLSIGFIPVNAEVNEKTGNREIYEVKLMEVSVVTFPANERANITDVKHQFKQLMDQLDGISQAKVLGFAEALKQSASTTSLDEVEPPARHTVAIKYDEKSEEDKMKVATITFDVEYEDAKQLEQFVSELHDSVSSKNSEHQHGQVDDVVEPQEEFDFKELESKLDDFLNNFQKKDKHSTRLEKKAVPEDGTMMRTSVGLSSDSQHRHNYRMGDTQTEVAVDSDGNEHRHQVRYDDAGEPIIVQAEGHDHPPGFPIGATRGGHKPMDEE